MPYKTVIYLVWQPVVKWSPKGWDDHRQVVERSVTPAWRWYEINNPEGPEGVAEQRYEVYEVAILPPLRGCCSHHAFSRGSVLRTPPPACTLTTPSGFVQHQTKIKQIKDEVKILTKGGILMVSSFDYPYNFLKESTVNNCISIQPDFRNLS